MTRVLDVYFHDKFAGKLRQEKSGKLNFAYDTNYLNDPQSYPLSIAMPLQIPMYDDPISQAFFGGLLPEASIRRRLAQNLQVSEGNTFKLLEAIGGECAGAVALYSEGKYPHELDANYKILTDGELRDVLLNLKRHPFLADTNNFRLSLAGAQDKLPILLMPDDKIAIPQRLPSSHILKIPINLPDRNISESVSNEFFCMQLAHLSHIHVLSTLVRRCHEIPYLLIQRYDRQIRQVSTADAALYGDTHEFHVIKRLHQEDFCQALGLPSQIKYQNEGGPSIAQCLDLIEKNSAKPAVDRLEFIRRIIFNYLIGNADAHGKNFSFLYIGKKPQLAPAYDLLSTEVYPDINKKMAMKIGGKYDPDRVFLRHWHRLISDSSPARKILETQLNIFATDLPNIADSLQKRLENDGFSSPIFQQIKAIIQKKSSHVLQYFLS